MSGLRNGWIGVGVAWVLFASMAWGGEVVLLHDFEAGEPGPTEVFAAGSRIERVDDGDGGHALRWIQGAAGELDGGWIDFLGLPESIRPFHAVRFRARVVGAWDGRVDVRFRGDEGYIGSPLPDVGTAWKIYDLRLPAMKGRGILLPEEVFSLRFVCWGTKGFELELDDIALLGGEGGWGRAEGGTVAASTQDPQAVRWVVADFEGETPLACLEATGGVLEVLPPEKKNATSAGRWVVPSSKGTVWIDLEEIPPTLEPYRFLRLRARAPKGFDEEVYVRFRGDTGYLSTVMPPLDKRGKWTDIEIDLPRMERDASPAPDEDYVMRLVVFGTDGFQLDIDDIELHRGPGGWSMTQEEYVASVFGEKRRKKVKDIETAHFRIHTDSAGARTKFPAALEKTYDFARETLGLEEMKEPLDVFIFQSSKHYFDFCVRKGWTQEAAERTAGHAWSRYFATYYQAPSSPVVAHELTHSLVHRIWGDGGGSWFQEGTAVCVEERWQKRDAATRFAPRLRSGNFVPLAEFMREARLIHGEDVRGGAHTSHAMYDQAGAFFEFLLRGPLAEEKPDAIRQLAKVEWSAATIVREVERIYGRSLQELERAWKEWGGDPPELES